MRICIINKIEYISVLKMNIISSKAKRKKRNNQ
jgi:hypothetical protein